MASVVISQLICTVALIALIIALPAYYTNVKNDIRVSVVKVELQEIADYVSSTLANTYYLANSTNSNDINLTKTLVYMPDTVENSFFNVSINGNSANATSVSAYLADRPSVNSTAWLGAGLKGGGVTIESGKGTIEAGCYRNSTGVFALIGYQVK